MSPKRARRPVKLPGGGTNRKVRSAVPKKGVNPPKSIQGLYTKGELPPQPRPGKRKGKKLGVTPPNTPVPKPKDPFPPNPQKAPPRASPKGLEELPNVNPFDQIPKDPRPSFREFNPLN